MSWAEERRQDRAAAREEDRLDRIAEREQDRADRAEAAERRHAEREERRGRWHAAAGWLGGHAAELLIYPLALVSAVMAVPAMADYGHDLYGDVTGYVLPALSELGMWAFAMAVLVARRSDPDRPVVMLNAGIGVFAGVGAGLNLAHGMSGHDGSLTRGLVMAVVSIAGVVAHQLAVAAPPRSRAQRAEARIARQAARRIARARRIAARTAVVELAADGTARLVHRPGLYEPRRGRLDPTTVPGLPVDRGGDEGDWDAALAGLDVDGGPAEPALRLGPTTEDPTGSTDPTTDADLDGWPSGSGGVAVLDPPESTRPAGDGDPGRVGPARPIDPQARRRLTADEALDAARRLARRTGRRVTAEQLRAALGVGSATARQIRDQVNAELDGGGR